MVGDDSGQLPSVLAQRVQLLLVRRFLFRQITSEQFVLPHSLIVHIDHRRDRRGAGWEIESMAHRASFHNQHSADGGRQPLNKLNNTSKLNATYALLVHQRMNAAELSELRCPNAA